MLFRLTPCPLKCSNSYLDLTALPEQEYSIILRSITGKTTKQILGRGSSLVLLDISNLANGKYIIQIKGENNFQSLNFLKK
ncbi:T9SS type A sorting domain-containing protein [uncultured Pontibacter sp.]|uniref:T9SS type A sorting domain-containing protein n=1 Tax=uncultured Pontibacter sp. TaxID=453356 RepID=UPI00344C7F43